MDWLQKMVKVHQSDDKKINAFGYILYTDEHPHTKKILRDPDYWNALDQLSGDNWIIYAIKPSQGDWEFPDIPEAHGNSRILYQMEPIWKEPKDNEELLSTFGVASTKALPLFILFVLDGGKFLSIQFDIDDDRIDDGFNSLKYIIHTAKEALGHIDQQHWKDNSGIFNSLELQIGYHRNNQRLKKLFSIIKELGPFFSRGS
ncbi:hypothetical protein [uncultured Pseudodesulfovibrio sp.]|uniref:hypothetical protein n=1 Tax=uncultured Pseudodesulfovibrio sp. TaxID=2035858 RepID=UPI0029C6C13A|nr:hypothetical protein [uncultured Pseudodesulfovibrio sp.]